MQPRRPQPQRSPPIRTTTWPISPAAPRPVHGRPSRTIPPPTPVPQNTPSSERYGRPAPSSNSASVATWTSLPRCARVPSACSSAGPSANSPSQFGRLRALVTVPAFASMSPGEPMPTPASASVSTPAWCAASVIAAAIAAATSSGPPSVGVGWRASPSTAWPASTTTAWIFVPPRSMPPRAAPFGVLMTRHAMPMDRSRLELPSAVLAAVAAAEAGVLLLRPREDPIAPAPVRESDHFSAEEIARAKAFRRPQRALALAGMTVDTAALAALPVRPPRLRRRRPRRPVGAAAATGAALAAGLTVAGLPLSALSRRRALKVGLATQSWPAWGADVAKATAIGAAFSAGGAAAGVALMRRLPRTWWVPGAGLAAGFGVLTTWLGPVVLDPIFNRFTPLPEGEARADVLELAQRAGVEVGEVYEVDASRRTTAANAYVNGIGATKRVVLFDTLLRDFSRDEVRLVVAHELGHVRHRDVPRFLAFTALAAPAALLAIAQVTKRLLPEAEAAGPRTVPAGALPGVLVGAPRPAAVNPPSRRGRGRPGGGSAAAP